MGSEKAAIIFGVTGQDGAYLSGLLVRRGYSVHGTSRGTGPFERLDALGVGSDLAMHRLDVADTKAVADLVEAVRPAEIYNLAAQSSVGRSFEVPLDTIDADVHGAVNVLDAMHASAPEARFFNAASSECFGDTGENLADETTPMAPLTPYGIGKTAAHWLIANARATHGLRACSGFLFNHESPLRAPGFVTQKVIRGAVDVAEGKVDSLTLGNIDVVRDWGWAPEYVEGMWASLQLDSPQDLVFATGKACSLRDFITHAFGVLGLDWSRHIVSQQAFFRPNEARVNRGNPAKAAALLNWRAETTYEQVAEKLIEAELQRRHRLAAAN